MTDPGKIRPSGKHVDLPRPVREESPHEGARQVAPSNHVVHVLHARAQRRMSVFEE